MKLIVGLGNPGKKYHLTRHNIGFIVLNELARQLKIDFKLVTKLNSEIAIFKNVSETIILAKPTTYMNLSGEAVLKIMDYYKIDVDDLIVISDDISLQTGRIRLRELGGHGGHNGLRSIIALLKTEKFKRIRIGIDYHENIELNDYVLGNFTKEEQLKLEGTVLLVVKALMDFSSNIPYKDIMTNYNTKM